MQATLPRSKAGVGCGLRKSIFLFGWQNRLEESVREVEDAEDREKELKWGQWEGSWGRIQQAESTQPQWEGQWRVNVVWEVGLLAELMEWKKAKSAGGGRIRGLSRVEASGSKCPPAALIFKSYPSIHPCLPLSSLYKSSKFAFLNLADEILEKTIWSNGFMFRSEGLTAHNPIQAICICVERILFT